MFPEHLLCARQLPTPGHSREQKSSAFSFSAFPVFTLPFCGEQLRFSSGPGSQAGGQLVCILPTLRASEQQSLGSVACTVVRQLWDISHLAPNGVCAVRFQLPQLSRKLFKNLSRNPFLLDVVLLRGDERIALTRFPPLPSTAHPTPPSCFLRPVWGGKHSVL